MRTLILVSAVAIGTTAMGASFENHLQSTAMVSPAQIYQIEETKTDFSLGFISADTESKPDGGEASTGSASGTGIFAAGVYNIKNIGLRAGLTLNYGSTSSTFESVSGAEKTESKFDGTSTIISPVAAYTAGPVVLGAAFDLVQTESKPEEGDTRKSTHNTFRPGALYADGPIEAGLTYASPNNIKAEKEDELDVEEPAIVTLHGRYALDNSMAIGGIIKNENFAALDEDNLDDRQTVMGTFEMNTGDLKIEGDLGYRTKNWKSNDETGDAGFGTDTISTIALGGAADYAVNSATNVGGALGYEFGSESNNDVEISTNTLSIAVRGNMSF